MVDTVEMGYRFGCKAISGCSLAHLSNDVIGQFCLDIVRANTPEIASDSAPFLVHVPDIYSRICLEQVSSTGVFDPLDGVGALVVVPDTCGMVACVADEIVIGQCLTSCDHPGESVRVRVLVVPTNAKDAVPSEILSALPCPAPVIPVYIRPEAGFSGFDGALVTGGAIAGTATVNPRIILAGSEEGVALLAGVRGTIGLHLTTPGVDPRPAPTGAGSFYWYSSSVRLAA